MNILRICTPHLSHVATLPREIQRKSFFNNIIHILQIIYVSSEAIGDLVGEQRPGDSWV